MRVFRKSIRRGVSLLEVMVSIGVTSVGLLGVLSLIPLGAGQTRQGQVLERAPVVGVSALAEVRARDMLAPMNWITKDGTTWPLNGGAFCIDPIVIASGSSTAVPGTFPSAPASGSVAMPRLSLWNYTIGPPDATPNTSKVMSLPMANAIFRSHDDVRIVDLQRDQTLPPFSVWDRATDPSIASTAPSRRQDEGHMSWMITGFPNLAKGSPYDLYTVSIVVFHRRVVDSALRGEYTVNVTSFPGGGVSGGDVVIDTSSFSADDLRESKTPENSWVLMSGQVGSIYVFQWYRVLGSEQDTSSRNITLAGPDWPIGNIASSQMTIIPGTVAVYQKNMQIEGTSLWRK